MDRFTLSLVVGAAAGALVAIPMIAQKATFRHCFAAFCVYLFAAVITFVGSGKESRPVPTLLNAVLVGFLISVAERYLA